MRPRANEAPTQNAQEKRKPEQPETRSLRVRYINMRTMIVECVYEALFNIWQLRVR